MLQLQQTTTDAVLCFAVHYDVRDVQHTSLGTLHLTQLGRVSHHCLDALRQQIAPILFAEGNVNYARSPNAEYFLATMRFAQFCQQTTHLWGDSFMLGLRRFYLDTHLPSVACRLLLEALRSVQHEKTAECGHYCAYCMLPPLIAQIDQTNVNGESLARVLVEQPCASLEKVTWYYDNYTREVAQLCAQLALALQSAGGGYTVREKIRVAMHDMCMERIEKRKGEWLQRLVDNEKDLYALLIVTKESALYDAIQRTATIALCKMSRTELDNAIGHFFETHVHSEEEWAKRPSELCAKLTQLIRGHGKPSCAGQWIDMLFRVHEQSHLCALNEQYDVDTLTRLIELHMSRHNKEPLYDRAQGDTEEVISVERLVAMLEHRDAQHALAKIFAPLPQRDPPPLCKIAQQQARDTQSAVHAAMSSEALEQSCDPFDIFVYQGGPPVDAQSGECITVLVYLDTVVPVVGSFDLPRLCEFLQGCNTVFNARHWRSAIPLMMRQALAERYAVSVCSTVVSIDALHPMMQYTLPCLAQLQAVDAFSEPVKQWLTKALDLFVREAQRCMYQSEWRCPCGREFTTCAPEAVQLCEAVLGPGDALYLRVASLEFDYAATLMRQGYMMMPDDGCERSECDDEYSLNYDDVGSDELYNRDEEDGEVVEGMDEM